MIDLRPLALTPSRFGSVETGGIGVDPANLRQRASEIAVACEEGFAYLKARSSGATPDTHLAASRDCSCRCTERGAIKRGVSESCVR